MSFDRGRRQFLGVTATLAVVGLAGCGGDGDGATDTPTDTEADTETETETGTEAGTATPQSYTVDMTNGLAYDPDSLTVAPGDTVVFENVGSVGHSVSAYEEDIPDGAEYWASGGFESEQAARDAYSATGSIAETGNVPGGESWSHTFETEGTHQYFCIPHEGAGMVGSIEVVSG